MPRHVWLALTFMALLITGVRCLKNVKLEVTPEAVELGHEATLRCDYDLEGVQLYSLKWYRGNYEFYRYSPSESPSIKIFDFPWIQVDPNNSNESQVTIRNVDFPLSGNFSCEVTSDGPMFSTASSSKTLTVVSVPKGKPVILSERGRYESGETLKANCSSPPSKPPARLSFWLNGLQVSETKDSVPQQKDYSAASRGNSVSSGSRHQSREARTGDEQRQWIDLEIHLQPFHYVNGQLNLRCVAKIPGIYEQASEVQLGSGLREPVPERVTSENAGYSSHRIADLTITGLVLLQLCLR